ncbi:MAG: phosphodiester glycosidase family protein [Candidatus Algichlamydia australiensis]|nr:phosphodiester glycosidase family protein [Chlamydiales bacterium]
MKKILFTLSAVLTLFAEKGFEYEHISSSVSPSIHVLRIDPKEYEIKLVPALDDGLGLERVASLCERKGAKAGINGSFFEYDNKYSGLPRWISKMEGRYFSISNQSHAAFGWTNDGKLTLFDQLKGKIYIEQNKKFTQIHGMNGFLNDGETLLFTPWFHRTTLTPYKTQEAIIENGKVVKMAEVGSNIIPDEGFILASPQGKPVIEYGAQEIRYKVELIPEEGSGTVGQWEQVENIVSSFPLLIKNGKRHIFKGEGPGDYTIDAFINTRHPRSAVGVRKDGTWIFAIIDGGAESDIGVNLHDLAEIMEKEQCYNAINLDGGSSSSLVIDGEYKNIGSGKAARVGNALLIFPRSQSSK